MSDERLDRAPSDEPDGTPPYTASLRPPGESVQPAGPHPAGPHDVSDDELAPDAASAGDDPFVDPAADDENSRAGYDVEAVSGDTDIYRPE